MGYSSGADVGYGLGEVLKMECPDCKGKGIFPPCNHPGCYAHVIHPCEECGRYQGKCKTCGGDGGECACELSNLQPCGENFSECHPGIKKTWDEMTENQQSMCESDCDFYIIKPI